MKHVRQGHAILSDVHCSHHQLQSYLTNFLEMKNQIRVLKMTDFQFPNKKYLRSEVFFEVLESFLEVLFVFCDFTTKTKYLLQPCG